MVARLTDAINAYNTTAATGRTGGLPARDRVGGNFADLVKGAAEDAVQNLRRSEQVGAAAAVGKADLVDVVTAISNAEVTLQTVVTVRDRVVSAYQEIMRMPV